VVALKTTSTNKEVLFRSLEKFLEKNYVPEERIVASSAKMMSEDSFQRDIEKLEPVSHLKSKKMPGSAGKQSNRESPESLFRPEKQVSCGIRPPFVPEKTFGDYLMEVIELKKLDYIDIYKAAGIDRKLFSKIMSPGLYHPSKETVFCLMLALKLPLLEAKEFLEFAGYAFSPSSKFDLVVRFCVENKIFTLFDVNDMLLKYADRTLQTI
jgi:hypothetical protein